MANNDDNKINNFFDYREYKFKIDNNEYNLRIEIIEKDIYFILFNLNEFLDYIYKNKIDILTMINKLELIPSKYSNSEIILKIFDNKYKKNQIKVNMIDDNSYNIIIKSLNILEEEITTEIKLIKEFMSENDKLKYNFDTIKLIKNNNKTGEKEELENIKNKLNELYLYINKRDKEIKDELKEKDTLIQKLNDKLMNQENIIKRIIDNNDIINKKYEDLENKLNERINSITNNLNQYSNNEKINKMMNDNINIINKNSDELVKLNNNNKRVEDKMIENTFKKAKDLKADIYDTPQGLTKGNTDTVEAFINEEINIYEDNSFNKNEKEAYCKLINKLLANDLEAKEKLPISPKSNEIFKKLKDGIIFGKLINYAFPGTIDERAINKDSNMTITDQLRNLSLCINSAKSIGCIIDITAEDILDEKKQKIIDLLYQILKIIVLKKFSLQYFPQLLRLIEDKEEKEELLALGPEDFLIRWFNFHLKKARHPKEVTNFSDDVKDSEKYIILINQLERSCGTSALGEGDLVKRAGIVLNNAQRIGAEIYIVSEDISNADERLNTLFIAV